MTVSCHSSLGLCPAGNGMMGTTTMACPVGMSHQLHNVHGASGNTYNIVSCHHLPIYRDDNKWIIYQKKEQKIAHSEVFTNTQAAWRLSLVENMKLI